jgi:DNA-binding NarL/FixJ family response regulator
MTLLLADDHPLLLDGLLRILADLPDVTLLPPVNNGHQLLDYLHQHPVDVVLLDLNMPKMDGREALKEIKSDPSLRSIPIVVLTTSKAEQDVLQTYDLGVNCFITKPVAFADFIEVTRTLGHYWFDIVQLPNITE